MVCKKDWSSETILSSLRPEFNISHFLNTALMPTRCTIQPMTEKLNPLVSSHSPLMCSQRNLMLSCLCSFLQKEMHGTFCLWNHVFPNFVIRIFSFELKKVCNKWLFLLSISLSRLTVENQRYSVYCHRRLIKLIFGRRNGRILEFSFLQNWLKMKNTSSEFLTNFY